MYLVQIMEIFQGISALFLVVIEDAPPFIFLGVCGLVKCRLALQKGQQIHR